MKEEAPFSGETSAMNLRHFLLLLYLKVRSIWGLYIPLAASFLTKDEVCMFDMAEKKKKKKKKHIPTP